MIDERTFEERLGYCERTIGYLDEEIEFQAKRMMANDLYIAKNIKEFMVEFEGLKVNYPEALKRLANLEDFIESSYKKKSHTKYIIK